ncbi:MAG: CHASE domain-containing protein [Phycisphaerales bacterium JB054]
MHIDDLIVSSSNQFHGGPTQHNPPGHLLTTLSTQLSDSDTQITTGFFLIVALLIIAGLLWRASSLTNLRSSPAATTELATAPATGRHSGDDAAVLAGQLFVGRLLLIGCAALSLVVLVAWLTGWKSAQSLVPGLPTMKFNTALGFLSTSLAGMLSTVLPTPASVRKVSLIRGLAAVLAGCAMILSCATLTQAGLGIELGIDTLVCPDPVSVDAGLPPGRMSQATAVGILLLSLGTMCGLFRAERLARWTLAIAGLIGAVAMLLFFLRGWNLRPSSVYSGISIHTSILLAAAALGLHFGFTARRKICAADLLEAVKAERSYALQTLGLVAAAMVLGLSATAIIVANSHKALLNNASSGFDRLCERILTETSRRVNQPVYGMKGARGAFAASESVTREEFEAYVGSRDLGVEFPGAIGMGFIDRVAREDLDTYTQTQRAEGADTFTVSSLATEQSPLYGDPTLYVIRHCYPRSRNAAAWGLDVGSEPVRRDAIERAIATGKPTISGKITLVQQEREHAGFLYYVPVYKNGEPTGTPEERRASLEGVIYAPIVLEEAMHDIIKSVHQDLTLTIYDGPSTHESSRLFASDHPTQSKPMFTSVHLLEVGGRTWTAVTNSTRRFESSLDRDSLGVIAASGVLLSCLFACFVVVTQISRSRAVALAEAKDHAETALREMSDLQLTLDTHTLVSTTDAQRRFISVNHQFCVTSGYTAEELLGRDYRVLQSDLCPASFWEHVWFSLDSGRAWRGEVCHRAKDGSTFWVDTVIMPFRDQQGTIQKHVILSSDITSRKLVERELRESSDRLNLAAQIAELGVWDWCVETGEIHWDETMFRIHGLTPTVDGSLQFAEWARLVLPEDLQEQEDILQNTAASGGQSEREFRIRRVDGKVRIIQAAEIAVVGPDGRCERVIGVNKDITESREAVARERANAELISRQNAELASLADRAHRVVDDVSHEFRTPLAVIKEFASIISDGIAGPVSDQQAEYLRIMDGSVIDLNHMVEDLLDSSKLRAGRLRVERKPVSVDTLFAQDRQAFARKASLRSLTIEEDVEPGLPLAFADGEKVRRVIANLMTNAIKFSRPGGTILLSAAEKSPGEITVSVTDSGAGLSEDDIDQLFGRFQQVSTARSVAAKGFGLGLSIAQELAWLNLGKLSVASEKGQGATFMFTLPTDSPDSVLSHYFEALRISDSPAHCLSLLRITRDHTPADEEDMAEPLDFLGSVTYPTDLILTSPWPTLRQESDPDSRTLWLLGRTRNPQRWLDRLHEARQEAIENESLNLDPLNVDLVQTWPYPDGASDAQSEVLATIRGGVPHGLERSHH